MSGKYNRPYPRVAICHQLPSGELVEVDYVTGTDYKRVFDNGLNRLTLWSEGNPGQPFVAVDNEGREVGRDLYGPRDPEAKPLNDALPF